jgi:magnesium transporter
MGESIETIEEEVLEDPRPEILQKIHSLRRDLIYFRKSIWSLRDGINSLIRDDLKLISDDVKVYLKDIYDHIVQVIDIVETNREIVFGLFDIYMSSLSNRMNEVMKVLTIIATIFIPLTFVAGIYGMNFNPEASPYNMPELEWLYGYPLSLLLMAGITAGMVIFFWRKDWI